TASQSRIQVEFVALASHELRTPVAAMCGLAATLHVRADTLADEQRTALIRVLHEQGQRLQQLVEQLLDLSRLEAPTLPIAPAPIAVRARTEDIVQATAGDRADE